MGRVYDRIDQRLERWIAGQPMFLVGTGPLDRDGHGNVSIVRQLGRAEVLTPDDVRFGGLLERCAFAQPTVAEYQRENNALSIDRLPALPLTPSAGARG